MDSDLGIFSPPLESNEFKILNTPITNMFWQQRQNPRIQFSWKALIV